MFHLCLRRFFAVTVFSLLFCVFTGNAQTPSLDSLLRRHIELRYGMFMHFNMNTYNPGWATGRTNPKKFNPSSLDCNQWATTAKAAKMTYGVLTAKHHDGFTLWPSKQTPPNGQSIYTVAQSSVPDKDIVMEYVTAFRAHGLEPGLYYSMWDKANGVNGGSAKEMAFIKGQLEELLGGKYGKIPLLMIDGWDWKMGHKSISYQEIRHTIKTLQPECLMTDMNGLMSPWEVDIIFVEEPKGLYMPEGNIYAACQSPSIAPGWFYEGSGKLMSVSNIVSHLTKLESAYTNFLLNCPPNKSGVFDGAIVSRLKEAADKWSPNLSRPMLPKQPPNVEYPISPASASASSGSAGAGIDGKIDCSRGVTTPSYCNKPKVQTLWNGGAPPAWITMDLGKTIQNIGIVGYLPQMSSTDGQITEYSVSLSTDNNTWTEAASGTWPATRDFKTVVFTPGDARYVRLTGKKGTGGKIIASEVNCGMIPPAVPILWKKTQHHSGPRQLTYMINGSTFMIPEGYTDKLLGIDAYTLNGQLLQSVLFSGTTFTLGTKETQSPGVSVLKIRPLD